MGSLPHTMYLKLIVTVMFCVCFLCHPEEMAFTLAIKILVFNHTVYITQLVNHEDFINFQVLHAGPKDSAKRKHLDLLHACMNLH